MREAKDQTRQPVESAREERGRSGRFLGETPAADEIGGDETGATTGVKPGEEPLFPRGARQIPIGNDPTVPGGHGEGP